MNDENSFTLTSTYRSSSSRRRSCLQKSINEGEKRGLEEEETTKNFRKSRRVSFSSKVHVKTIDDSVNDHNSSKEKLTMENTKKNKLLADISNQNLDNTQIKDESIKKSKQIEDPANHTILPVHYLNESTANINMDITNMEASNMDICNNSNSFINVSNSVNRTTLETSDMNISNDMNLTVQNNSGNMSKSMVGDLTMNNTNIPMNDVTVAVSIDETVMDDSTFVDKTLEVLSPNIDIIRSTQSLNITDREQSINIESNNKGDVSITVCKNITYNTDELNSSDGNNENTLEKIETSFEIRDEAEQGPESVRKVNEKSMIKMVDSTYYIAESQINEITMPTTQEMSFKNDCSMNYSMGASNLSFNTSKLLQSLQHTSINELETSQAAIDLTVGGYSKSSIDQFLHQNFKELKDTLIEKIAEAKQIKIHLENMEKEKKCRAVNIEKENVLSKDFNKELKAKYMSIREQISKIKIENGMNIICSNVQNENEKLSEQIKELSQKNEKREKSLKHGTQNLADIKDKIQANTERIKSLQSTQIDEEKFLALGDQIFNNEVIEYTLVNLEQDNILLSFFFDFIQLEINATSIVNFTKQSSDLEKRVNYPIQKLLTRSLIDSVGTQVDSPYYTSDQDRNILKRKNSKRVPVYIKYCVNLVLQDIGEGDLLSLSKRYKYIKDIPLLIAKFNLACKCATNLAKDFEHFASKTYDSEVRCDFDINNHLVTIILPSIEDSCFYKLKLSLFPGKYYQEPIPFSIEPVNEDDVFKPNIKRLSKVIEGQHFEEGSLRHFLHKLKLV